MTDGCKHWLWTLICIEHHFRVSHLRAGATCFFLWIQNKKFERENNLVKSHFLKFYFQSHHQTFKNKGKTREDWAATANTESGSFAVLMHLLSSPSNTGYLVSQPLWSGINAKNYLMDCHDIWLTFTTSITIRLTSVVLTEKSQTCYPTGWTVIILVMPNISSTFTKRSKLSFTQHFGSRPNTCRTNDISISFSCGTCWTSTCQRRHCEHGSMVTWSISTKHRCVQVQPHRALKAGIGCLVKFITLSTFSHMS